MAKNGNIIPIYGKKWQRFLPFSVDSLCWRQTDFRYHFIAIRYHMLPYVTICGVSILNEHIENILQHYIFSSRFCENLDPPKVR